MFAPAINHEMAMTVQSYQSHLAPSAAEAIPFDLVSLERLVAAMADGGLTEVARDLAERYLDFSPVYDLIDDWTPQTPRHNSAPLCRRGGLIIQRHCGGKASGQGEGAVKPSWN